MPRNPRQGLTTLGGLLLPALILLILTAVTASLATSTRTAFCDANGNMLTGLGGKIMTYDGENRPLSVT